MMQRRRRGAIRGIVIAAVVAVLLFSAGVARFYTDVLWFQEVGFSEVLWRRLTMQLVLGVLVGGAIAAIVWINLMTAAKTAPAYRVPRVEVIGREDPMDRYRDLVAPYVRWIRLGIALLIGLFAGLAASSSWQTVLLWSNRASFGQTDPQFGLDVGFYVFELPFYDLVLSWLWAALVLSVLLSAGAHYFHGSVRPDSGLAGITSGALAHISVLLGCLALVKAAQYWFGRYQLNFSERGVVTGASYTDVSAHLPALQLLAIISLVSAGLFFANIRARRFLLPAAAVGIWVVFAVLAGAAWPAAVQNFSVEPNEQVREEPYIERNIDATRDAFGLTDVKARSFNVSDTLSAEAVESNEAVFQNARLWDPDLLQRAYEQLQAIRAYYDFEDVDIDRYEIDGVLRQVLLSGRELSVDNVPSPTWANLHLQYTHGYGLVASLANEATPAGQPEFIVKDIPGDISAGAEELELEDPNRALYFGEAADDSEYSIVDTGQAEVDYSTEAGVQRSRYAGRGGITVGGLLRRIAFAIRESDPNLLLSRVIQPDSRILLYKNVRDRVRRIAPFLNLDHDSYVAAVDGDLKWILDAYTSTAFYPYSQRFLADELIGDVADGTLSGPVNYVRNSVKVVVDAYDGDIQFYIVDEDDALVQAWSDVFPGLFTEDEPSAGIQAHFRYPEDLFSLQSHVHTTYHVTDADDFYAGEDQWSIPQSRDAGVLATETTSEEVPPTYLLVRLPGEDEQQFVLTRPFTPRTKNNMIAFMAAKSDPQEYGELLTLLFPRQLTVLGPSQVNNLINQDVEISQARSLLGREGSTLRFGSLVILPVANSMVYVQPLFVEAEETEGATGIPELKRVVVVHGEEVTLGTTFGQALAEAFDLSVAEGPAGEPGEVPRRPEDGAGAPEPPGGPDVDQFVQQANQIYDRAQQALARGDFETYGRLIERLGRLLDQASG